MEYPEREFIVMPTVGKFIVRIKKYLDYITKKLDYYMVLIGNDPRNACVNIRAPYNSSEPLKLSYVTSEVACTLDNVTPMKGAATIQMIQLGITIARELSPLSTTLELDDCSHFMCSSPIGNKKMALPSFYIAFHGKTWYEEKFNAYLKDPVLREEYQKGIDAMDNPESKPATFRFINPDITEMVYPLFVKAKTWRQFFTAIAKKYGSKKCWIVQPWIEDAIGSIFGNASFEMKTWVVELKTVPMIAYYELSESVPQLGGGWNCPISERIMHRSSFYPFHLLEYKKAMRRTRKVRRTL